MPPAALAVGGLCRARRPSCVLPSSCWQASSPVRPPCCCLAQRRAVVPTGPLGGRTHDHQLWGLDAADPGRVGGPWGSTAGALFVTRLRRKVATHEPCLTDGRERKCKGEEMKVREALAADIPALTTLRTAPFARWNLPAR